MMTPEQQMLCLAALTYRDFADAGPPLTHGVRFRQDVEAKLKTLAPDLGRWTVVWGPASYRAPLSFFDDAAMFVVQSVDRPNEYVVAVRGTNPISAFDWLFGDLWVAGQIPWAFDEDGAARISLSTALGLDVLLGLSTPTPPVGGVAAAGNVLGRAVRGIEGAANHVVDAIRGAGGDQVLTDLQAALGSVAASRLRLQGRDSATRLAGLHEQWSDAVRGPLVRAVADALRLAGGAPSLSILSLLERNVSIATGSQGGDDVTTFLKRTVAAAPAPVDVTVTGHSKGGALAPTLALWLAENQKIAPDAPGSWDPRGDATVSCYHFAGPTAGNAEFVTRSNGKIGDRCFGFVNPLDVVTKAWEPDPVGKIASLYDAKKVVPIPGMDSLVTDIAAVLTAQKLGYGHVGNAVETFDGKLADGVHDFVGQMIYQHLEAYLVALGIDNVVSVETFFNPLK